MNGDGFADLIVGAPGATSTGGPGQEGESYVIFGGDFTGSVAHLGDAGDDTLTGTTAAETFVGGTGNDTLIGNGGADAFQGGAGDDVVRVSTLDFLLVDGGSGSDTLELDGLGLHLDLTALADSRTRSIERIDIGGDGNNTLTLSVLEVLNLSDESNELLVLGDAGDVVNQGPGWTAAASGGRNFLQRASLVQFLRTVSRRIQLFGSILHGHDFRAGPRLRLSQLYRFALVVPFYTVPHLLAMISD